MPAADPRSRSAAAGPSPRAWVTRSPRRGAFLAHGSLTEPGRSAALEVTCPGPEAALSPASGPPGASACPPSEVRGIDRVVVRDGDAIALLTRMGAHDAVLAWEHRTRGVGHGEPARPTERRRPAPLAAVGRRARVQRAFRSSARTSRSTSSRPASPPRAPPGAAEGQLGRSPNPPHEGRRGRPDPAPVGPRARTSSGGVRSAGHGEHSDTGDAQLAIWSLFDSGPTGRGDDPLRAGSMGSAPPDNCVQMHAWRTHRDHPLSGSTASAASGATFAPSRRLALTSRLSGSTTSPTTRRSRTCSSTTPSSAR